MQGNIVQSSRLTTQRDNTYNILFAMERDRYAIYPPTGDKYSLYT